VTVKVVDASVVAAILFAEPEIDQALAMLQGCDLIAPQLLPYEVANVATTKRRRHPESSELIDVALGKFAELGIVLVEPDVQAIYRSASASGLTGYDAAYLWLSRHEGVEIATFDRKLQAASMS